MVSQDPVFFLAPKREIPNQCPINQKGRTPTNPANTKPSLFPSEMKLNKMTKAGKEKIPTNTPPQAKANTIGKDTLVSHVLWIHLPAPLFIKDDMIHMWAQLFIKDAMDTHVSPIIHQKWYDTHVSPHYSSKTSQLTNAYWYVQTANIWSHKGTNWSGSS